MQPRCFSVFRPAIHLALLFLCGGAGVCLPARAATFNIPDGDVTALIGALASANGNNEDDTIDLASGGTYTLTGVDNPTNGKNGLPVIGSDSGHTLTIYGHGATVQRSAVDGTLAFRILQTASGATVTLSGLTLTNGLANASGADAGGGILNGGNLTVHNCTLSDNHTAFGGGLYNSPGSTATLTNCTLNGNSGIGGGIASSDATLALTDCTLNGNQGGGLRNGGGYGGQGTATLTNCTLSGNTTDFGANGGGIVNASDCCGRHATLTLKNCTLSGNSASGHGGAISNEAGETGTVATLLLADSTLSGNSATDSGGGIFNVHSGGTATVQLGNTILKTGASGANLAKDTTHGGTITSQGYNLSSDNGGGFLTGVGDQINTNPLLDPAGLQNNGGPTKTIALQANSPAVDQGNSALHTDQRGRVRPYDHPALANAPGGDGSDIGAYERQALRLSINNVTVNEANGGTVNATFIVLLEESAAQTVTVHYATADGTATAPNDYTSAGGTLTFSPGQISKAINVAVKGDILDEPHETFKVTLSGATNAAIGDGLGVATIQDNDPAPRFFIDDVSVLEGDSGTVAANFHLTLSAASARLVTVTYKTADGTATAGADYVAQPSTTLTFTPGQTSKTITVLVNGDTADEANETFKVVLQSATVAAIVDDKGVATITDDDPLPSLAIQDAPTKAEGPTGATHNALFVVTLTGATQRTVTVNYATANGTATAGSDYTAATGTLTFLPGQTSKTLPIQVQGDAIVEPDETFKVNLTGASFATISGSQGSHTITNDDASE